VNPGQLIAFEGLDGCGKTTQVERLAARLRLAGSDPLLTREPSDGPWGRRIRAMARGGELLAVEEELHWFVEDRREHVATLVAPALAEGRLVVTDRYFLSTVAYQGARGLEWRQLLARSEAEFPLPDLVVLLDIGPELALERVRTRAPGLETLFERRERLARVAEIFRAIERPYLERLDAAAAPERVAEAVAACVRRRLELP